MRIVWAHTCHRYQQSHQGKLIITIFTSPGYHEYGKTKNTAFKTSTCSAFKTTCQNNRTSENLRLGQVILDLEYIHLIKWITLTWCILWYSDSMASLLDRKRQKLVDHSDKVQMLRGTINSLREEKLRIENDLQQRIKLEEDKANWAAETEACKREIQVSGYMLMQGWWDFYKNEYLKIVTKYVRL